MPRVYDPDLGKRYGKPDLERLGLFVEMPYMNGKKYVSPFEPPKYHKGMTFLSGGYKSKNGTQHGYFEEEFKRLFEGEGITWRKPKQTGRKKKLGPLSPFIVGIRGKSICTPGDYFGTFSGRVDAFSNVRKKKPKYVSPNANFQTSNPKKGGPGYANICINPYPTHM
ncbi:PREDICTED: UPF0602 protein C4orf47 homolog [Nicrophorus vespilloides]|uniref:Cilia-and flagella-associated protein 96 n=1 Tax=Nicrophorus vespilloides TaxID=110193 RepID=A0ABM1NDB5_NICVS|nr:PREDICTED: UPF0602 protein C4orf47 homolog [Nicrophorus vespilloides]